MRPSAERVPTALLFTRGESSVHMEVTEPRAGGFHVTVRGPGLAAAEYTFPDAAALLAFTQQEEVRLIGEGFQLMAVAERRRGPEANDSNRGPERRAPRAKRP